MGVATPGLLQLGARSNALHFLAVTGGGNPWDDLPAMFFDLDGRALAGGTLDPLDAPLASDVLEGVPTWDAEIEGGGIPWGGQADGFDIVVFIKRPLDDSIWVAEGGGIGSGTLTGASEPDWDTDPTSGVTDGGYTWYPSDPTFPTSTAWTPSTMYQPGALVEKAGLLWARYPAASDSGTTEPDWLGGIGNYVSDGGGYWWPVGTLTPMSLLTAWPDQSGNGRDATLANNPAGSESLTGFFVGTAHGHTTVTGGPMTGLTISTAWPDADDEGYILTTAMLLTLADGGRAAAGAEMIPATYDPANGQYYEDIYSTDGDLEASRVVGSTYAPQPGGPQPGQTIIIIKVHNDGQRHGVEVDHPNEYTVPRGLSHVHGYESTLQTTANGGGDALGPDVMVGNLPGGDYGFCGPIHRYVSWPGALDKAQRLAVAQMLAAQAAADGITVTLYDETDPSDIAIGWEPNNDTLTGLLDIWYVPDDAVVDDDVLELVGAVNGEVLSNDAPIGTVAARVGLDGLTHKYLVMDGSSPLIHPTKHTFAFTSDNAGKWWLAFVAASAVDAERWLFGNGEMTMGGFVNGAYDGRAHLFGNDSFHERAPHCWRVNFGDLDHAVAWAFQFDNTKRTLSTSGDIDGHNDGQGISCRTSSDAGQGTNSANYRWHYVVDVLDDAVLDGLDPANYFTVGAQGAAAATGNGFDGADSAFIGPLGLVAVGTGVFDKAEANQLMAWAHRRWRLRGPFQDTGALGETN